MNGSGPWSIRVMINGAWREVAHVEGTPRQMYNLEKVIRVLGDDVHADAASELQAENARRQFEATMQSAADGHPYQAPEAQ